MKRTTIMLPEELDARIRLEARRRGVSIADIAREAIEQHVPGPPAAGRLGFFAIGEGEPTDASERVDEFVGKAITRRRGSERPA
ncbi:MAG: CopG family transcriptional regulator [Acidimicrobiales bacterium]